MQYVKCMESMKLWELSFEYVWYASWNMIAWLKCYLKPYDMIACLWDAKSMTMINDVMLCIWECMPNDELMHASQKWEIMKWEWTNALSIAYD